MAHAHAKNLKPIVPFILVFIFGVTIGAYFHKETIVVRENVADTPAALSSVNLMIDDGEGHIRVWNTVSWHEAMSVVGLLEVVANVGAIQLRSEESEYGKTVAAIDGIANDDASGLRWQYWVNNTYEPRVAGKYFLKPGDIVVLKYAPEQEK